MKNLQVFLMLCTALVAQAQSPGWKYFGLGGARKPSKTLYFYDPASAVVSSSNFLTIQTKSIPFDLIVKHYDSINKKALTTKATPEEILKIRTIINNGYRPPFSKIHKLSEEDVNLVILQEEYANLELETNEVFVLWELDRDKDLCRQIQVRNKSGTIILPANQKWYPISSRLLLRNLCAMLIKQK